MNDCRQVEDLLPLHAVGDTSLSEEMQVEEHVGACARCRDALEAYRLICATARRELSAAPPVPRLHISGWRRSPIPARAGWFQLVAAVLILLAGLVLGRLILPPPRASSPRDGLAAPAAEVLRGGRRLEAREHALRTPTASVFAPALRKTLSRAAQRDVPSGG